MRIVLDTNVVVSALLTPGGTAHQVVQLILRGDLQPCVDARIRAEYAEVLARGRFRFSPERVTWFLEALLEDAAEVLPAPLAMVWVDEDDRAFGEVAVAAKAEALVTGNLRHFRGLPRLAVRVVAPREFLTWWQKRRD